MDNDLRILLVEDSDTDTDLLVHFLKKEEVPFCYFRVTGKEEFNIALDEFSPDLIISDQSLPDFNGMEALRLVRNGPRRDTPFILLTGTVPENILTRYMKEGLDDYILKENLLRLPSAIKNAVYKKKIEKLHKELTIKNMELENLYSSIRDSIGYAKMIQEATLPPIPVFQKIFPESFILNYPKDVLSGDFFWYEKKEECLYIAVADCTGHGVPGALLSMMGNNLLNEAVNIKNIRKPAAVVERLNRRVRKVLRHETSSIRDGMDLAFCSIDLENRKLEYCGANRPLFHLREDRLTEIKPDRKSIGGIYKNAKFTSHQMDIVTGDRIFLFTDGFVDQFHFNSSKKMLTRRLKELIRSTGGLPLSEQGIAINEFFAHWKGNIEQVDDVLLIGLRVK